MKPELLEHMISTLEYYAETSSGREGENQILTNEALEMLYDIRKNGLKVEIGVSGGVASIEKQSEYVDVTINDYD